MHPDEDMDRRAEERERRMEAAAQWCLECGERMEILPPKQANREMRQLPTESDPVWYGKIHGMGECVLEEELEEVKR